MNLNDLESVLDSLYGTIITGISIDLLNNNINFCVRAYHSEVDYVEKTIVFGGVASYFFSARSGITRRDLYPPDVDDIREMSSIIYYNNGAGSIGFVDVTDEWAKGWVHNYGSNVNFLVDMTDAILFIEANKIRINDVEFYVDYPNKY